MYKYIQFKIKIYMSQIQSEGRDKRMLVPTALLVSGMEEIIFRCIKYVYLLHWAIILHIFSI